MNCKVLQKGMRFLRYTAEYPRGCWSLQRKWIGFPTEGKFYRHRDCWWQLRWQLLLGRFSCFLGRCRRWTRPSTLWYLWLTCTMGSWLGLKCEWLCQLWLGSLRMLWLRDRMRFRRSWARRLTGLGRGKLIDTGPWNWSPGELCRCCAKAQCCHNTRIEWSCLLWFVTLRG